MRPEQSFGERHSMTPPSIENTISGAETGIRKSEDTPGVLAPGPWLMFGALICGHALDFVWHLRFVADIPRTYRVVIALLLGAIGGWLVFRANVVFHRLGTAFQPWRPTSTIASADIYGRTRN